MLQTNFFSTLLGRSLKRVGTKQFKYESKTTDQQLALVPEDYDYFGD